MISPSYGLFKLKTFVVQRQGESADSRNGPIVNDQVDYTLLGRFFMSSIAIIFKVLLNSI